MTFQEGNRRHQRSQRDPANDHRVLSFREWCDLNGLSPATGYRIIKAGTGPTVVQLSPRRIGITVRANREWQDARARGTAA